MKTDDKIVTFEAYYDPILAHIVRTRLESNGIPCFIADENIIGAVPFYNQAVGGIKLKVFEKDIDRCREILATDVDLHEKDHHEIDDETKTTIICPYCASTNVISAANIKDTDLLSSLINLVNPFSTQKAWHCNNCRQNFD
jgi:hypothetical protein